MEGSVSQPMGRETISWPYLLVTRTNSVSALKVDFFFKIVVTLQQSQLLRHVAKKDIDRCHIRIANFSTRNHRIIQQIIVFSPKLL